MTPAPDEVGVPRPVLLHDVAQALCCTARNAKQVLRKLEGSGMISWHPGQGRGHHSWLTFHLPLAPVVQRHFEERLRKEDLTGALSLLRHARLPEMLRSQLLRLLELKFGMQTEPGQNSTLDILRIPVQGPLGPLDPAQISTLVEGHLINQVCDTLVRFDPTALSIRPHLAHAWECNSEQTVWGLHLRKGVRFHHGGLLTAQDVLYSLQRLAGTPSEWILQGMESMEAHGDTAIRFRLRKPNRMFMNMLAVENACILPRDMPFTETRIIGSGPFQLAEYTPTKLVLTPFEAYFQGRPLLDRIDLWLMELGVPVHLHYQTVEQGNRRAPNAEQAHELPEEGCFYVALNFGRSGPHHDPAFRKALRLALDRVAWVRELGNGQRTPAAGFSPARSGQVSWREVPLSEAASWLQRSAYRGEPLRLHYPEYYADHGSTPLDAEWIQRRCAQIGIHVTLHPFSSSDLNNPALEQNADLIFGMETFNTDRDISFIQFIQQRSSLLYRTLAPKWASTLAAFSDQLLAVDKPETRYRIEARFEDWLERECLFLCNYHVRHQVRFAPGIEGIELSGLGWADFRRLWVRPALLPE